MSVNPWSWDETVVTGEKPYRLNGTKTAASPSPEYILNHHHSCPRAQAWDEPDAPCTCPRGWPRRVWRDKEVPRGDR